MNAKKTVVKKTAAKKAAPVAAKKQEVRKETSMRFVGKRISTKTAKLFLATTPVHGDAKRSTVKLYTGLSEHVPGAMRKKFFKNDAKRQRLAA